MRFHLLRHTNSNFSDNPPMLKIQLSTNLHHHYAKHTALWMLLLDYTRKLYIFYQRLFRSHMPPFQLLRPYGSGFSLVSLPFHAFHPRPSVAGPPCTPHPAHKACLYDSPHCTTAPNSPASLRLGSHSPFIGRLHTPAPQIPNMTEICQNKSTLGESSTEMIDE